MRIGDLRCRVVIQRKVKARDVAYGGVADTWEYVADAWAKIAATRTLEHFAAESFIPEVTHIITMRYLDGITPDMRVTYQGFIYDIKGVNNVGAQNNVLELKTVQGANNG